jgi:hypothetical protein
MWLSLPAIRESVRPSAMNKEEWLRVLDLREISGIPVNRAA